MQVTYRKKLDTVQAEQFNPHKRPWPEGVISWDTMPYHPRDRSYGFVKTHEGDVHIQAFDWIITDTNGEKTVCKDEAFATTYELAQGSVGGRRTMIQEGV